MAYAFAKQQSKPQNDQVPVKYKQAVEKSLSSPPLGYVVNSHNIKNQYRFKEEIKIYEPLIGSLERALSKPLFCCGGSLRPSDMEDFVLKVKLSGSNQDSWKEFPLANLPVDELLKYCNPAPFGDLKEMKTVLDSKVRFAYEIEPGRFDIKSKSYDYRNDFPGRESIEAHIEDVLTPGRRIELNQNKLNVYGQGGFFKPHVDNPCGHEMTGTVVLCLPSRHKGGELLVNHDGLQHVFDFSQHSGDVTRVQWAAFYSDCIHEIKPVVEGYRMTVTYNITLPNNFSFKDGYFEQKYIVPSDVDEHFEASAESPSLTTRALAEINGELGKMYRQGGSLPTRVGFLLKYKYTFIGLKPELLKGEDKALFNYLSEKQLKCQLKSVLSRYQTVLLYRGGDDYDYDSEYEETHEIYEFNPLPYIGSVMSPLDHCPDVLQRQSLDHRRFGDFRKWRVGIPFIEIYREEKNRKQLVRNEQGCERWVGNEIEDCGVDKIYLDSAAIVELRE